MNARFFERKLFRPSLGRFFYCLSICSDSINSKGVFPVNYLKTAKKFDLEAKPDSIPIPSIVNSFALLDKSNFLA